MKSNETNITLKIKYLSLIILLILVSSCVYTKGFTVVNTTAQKIEVTILFNNRNVSTVNFFVSKYSDELIMYEVNNEIDDYLSLGLKEIILTNKNCQTHISRIEVEKTIKIKGLWKLTVVDETFSCPS